MLDTIEEKQDFLASEELWYDPMFQPSMDSMWHNTMKNWPNWREMQEKK